MASLGKHIRKARVEQGMSQEGVAEKLGVSQVTVSNWEIGKSTPSEVQLKKLEKLLDVARPGRPKKDDAFIAEGTRAFARWLESARTSANLSVSDLAATAGVSVPAICNIESGRSPNPRKGTRRKLERALHAKAPPEVVEVAEESGQIEGLGPLTDFDPHDKVDRPKSAGVYVFYDVSDRPIYVGEASDISRRVREHEEKFWFKHPIVSTAAYVEINDQTLRHQAEQVLIKFLKSNAVINRQSVNR